MYRSRISCIRRISASAGTSSGKVQGGFIGTYLSACLIIGGAENAAYLADLPPPRLGLLKTKLRRGELAGDDRASGTCSGPVARSDFAKPSHHLMTPGCGLDDTDRTVEQVSPRGRLGVMVMGHRKRRHCVFLLKPK